LLDRLKVDNPDGRILTILDGYHLDADFQREIRQTGCKVMMIDDMNHLQRYDVDVLLNQNIHADTFTYNCDSDTIMLLGLKYALLRPEFLLKRKPRRKFPTIARKILITLGGADPDNVTAKVIEALMRIKFPQMQLISVLGPVNTHGAIVKKTIENSSSSVRMMHSPQNMADLMNWADLAISAGGSTCWELALMGLPFVTLVLAENQRLIAEGLERAGVTFNLGWHRYCSIEDMTERILELTCNSNRRCEMAKKGQSLVDGDGCRRVVSNLLRI